MMNKIIRLIAILCCASPAYAGSHALQIELTNGNKELYRLAEKPIVSFAGSDLSIKSSTAETSYPRAEVRTFTFVDIPSGIDDRITETTYSFTDNIFRCDGHEIEVYAMSGVRMAYGADSVSLRDLADGIYIVRCNNKTIKVIKK